jgi:hypothetical protein
MKQLNNTDKKPDNTKKELHISDVSDNHTRFYIPTDQKKTNSLMVILDKTLVTTNPHREMFHEKTGDKLTQFVTGTLDPDTGELKLVFFVDRLKDFVSKL